MEETAIDEGEAENLARAIAGFVKQRKVKLNKDLLAWGNFATVALTIYLPRVIALLAKRRAGQTNVQAAREPLIVAEVDANGNLKPQVPN